MRARAPPAACLLAPLTPAPSGVWIALAVGTINAAHEAALPQITHAVDVINENAKHLGQSRMRFGGGGLGLEMKPHFTYPGTVQLSPCSCAASSTRSS